MSRYKPLTERRATDRKELKGIIQNPLSDPDLAIRAEGILKFLDGMTGDAIAKELNVRPNTVSDWRKRYEADGIEGLYDKAPKGKRGSSVRDNVLKMLEQEPPEGGWTTKSLADAVGTSQDTVRRALKDEHVVLSKSYIWDKEIERSPAKVCVDAIGLYIAKEEAGFIIRVESKMDPQSTSFITTCNRNLAKCLEEMSRSEKGISLEDAIMVSVQQMKEGHRGNKDTFQDFLGKLFKENARENADRYTDAGFYYIQYWHESRQGRPILQKIGMIVEETQDFADWIRMIKPWIDIMSQDHQGMESPDSLVSLINLFMSKTSALVEPFEWRRATV
ncbi:MAG: helix-turn-helix domain-containing protein [Clostridia bacterium]|nr:helix-turn-helix domain-containing protein [Clostridia bacterium]